MAYLDPNRARPPAPEFEQKRLAAAVHANAPLRPFMKVLGELNQLAKMFRNNAHNDNTTIQLRMWVDNFQRALNHPRANADEIRATFIQLLREILFDPLYDNTLLEEDAVLYSDGNTYNKRTLEIHQCKPGVDSNRSPARQNDPAPFAIVANPHPNVREAVQWLKKYVVLEANPAIEKEHEYLVRAGRIRNQVAAVAPAAIAAAAAPANEYDAIIQAAMAEADQADAEADALANRIAGQIAHFGAENQLRLAQIEKQNGNEMDAFAKEMRDRFAQQEQANKQRIAGLNAQAEQLAKDVANLEEEIKQLEDANRRVQNGINDVANEQRQLQILIKQTEQKIKDNKENVIRNVAIAAAIVIVCVAVNYALPGSGPAAAKVGVSLAPKNGAAMLNFVIATP